MIQHGHMQWPIVIRDSISGNLSEICTSHSGPGGERGVQTLSNIPRKVSERKLRITKTPGQPAPPPARWPGPGRTKEYRLQILCSQRRYPLLPPKLFAPLGRSPAESSRLRRLKNRLTRDPFTYPPSHSLPPASLPHIPHFLPPPSPCLPLPPIPTSLLPPSRPGLGAIVTPKGKG